MGWLWLVGSIKLWVSFVKESCKRDIILRKTQRDMDKPTTYLKMNTQYMSTYLRCLCGPQIRWAHTEYMNNCVLFEEMPIRYILSSTCGIPAVCKFNGGVYIEKIWDIKKHTYGYIRMSKYLQCKRCPCGLQVPRSHMEYINKHGSC